MEYAPIKGNSGKSDGKISFSGLLQVMMFFILFYGVIIAKQAQDLRCEGSDIFQRFHRHGQ